MLLFQKRFHDGLVSGRITLTFRRWDKPRVRPGGRYRCHPIGVLEVDSIRPVRIGEISARDAKLSGFESRQELIEYLSTGPRGPVDDATVLYRIELRHGGDGDRVEVALDDRLTPDDVRRINDDLSRMDRDAAWTRRTLRTIERNPRVAASQLAKRLGRETAPFKQDVRKLKRLGLTQSFEVGYELSPRGRAYLEAIRSRRKPSTGPRKA